MSIRENDKVTFFIERGEPRAWWQLICGRDISMPGHAVNTSTPKSGRMLFQKEHLQNGYYNWTTGLNHSIQNTEPDRRVFDRFNGDQVLFIINCFGNSLGKFTIKDGLQIEELISTQLPPEIKSELSAFNWLRGNYMYYNN